MNLNRLARNAALTLGLVLFSCVGVRAQEQGVIDDPDGYTNVRSKPDTSAPVVAKVNTGEVFTYETEGIPQYPKWLKVTLPSGKTGWMHASRIVIRGNMEELKDGSPTDEINIYGKGKGIDYYPLARAAARGEQNAMVQYFGIDDTDGAAAETHFSVLRSVIHLLGDDKLSAFLKTRTAQYRKHLWENLEVELTFWPFEPTEYLNRHFPKSVKLLIPE
ncbi:SH3 domain-containing protein [Roseimicrobium sp. ORNL1]|uniref:SH3 domain-containing protein n=1 Tax=Roseimicrobium sp. ORNL1 TaxID=2711231 RepID=UPI0013E0EEEF|nr:SH3 domain-containing protein [Roseimicrobium sp. ORNL1]QIF01473.1 SH3 domain-containing protein [Roseimicrobium sp. ORNL1]